MLQARLPESRLTSTSRTVESARALTLPAPTRRAAIGAAHFNPWPIEHCANEPEPFLFRSPRGWPLRGFIVLLLSLLAVPTFSAVHQVQSIGLTVSDLDQEMRFFTQVLAFDQVSHSDSDTRESAQLLGLSHTKLKVGLLKLGKEKITLTEHSEKGQPIPPDSRSNDRWFQHIAIVVQDMDKAYHHLRQSKVKFVSSAPQTLPEWNKSAAGIKAFYFRDPEDHVLEIIWFPPGKGDPKWQVQTDNLFLGIDHTAIVVSDTDTSLGFYRDLLGLRLVGESENYGVEQEHLNQIFGAHLRITSLRAGRGPGIEFLEYLTPPGGRPLPETSKSNDLVFWHTDVTVDDLDDLQPKLKRAGAKLISARTIDLSDGYGPRRGLIVRDPDGHALEFLQENVETASSAQR